MTGNVVELVSKYLGVIRPGYALASCLATGDISDSLDCELFAVLEKDLEVVDPTALELDAPPAWQQHDVCACSLGNVMCRPLAVVTIKSGSSAQRQRRSCHFCSIRWQALAARVPAWLLQSTVNCASS